MAYRHEALEHGADHALRRRVGGDELGMLGLDRLQLLEQRVVVGVGDRRRVAHVVVVARGARAARAAPRRVVPGRAPCRAQMPARARVISAAGTARQPLAFWPDQRGEKSPLPRASAAARSGAIAAVASGNSGALGVVDLAHQPVDDAARRPPGDEPRQRGVARCSAHRAPRDGSGSSSLPGSTGTPFRPGPSPRRGAAPPRRRRGRRCRRRR